MVHLQVEGCSEQQDPPRPPQLKMAAALQTGFTGREGGRCPGLTVVQSWTGAASCCRGDRSVEQHLGESFLNRSSDTDSRVCHHDDPSLQNHSA